MRAHDDHDLMTPAEVAQLFKVSPKTVTRWARAGKLTAVRTLGGHRRFHRTEVETKYVEVEPPSPAGYAPSGATSIAFERWRQVHTEGHTTDHDDAHDKGELVLAAWAYLTEHDAFGGEECGDDPPDGWPWSPAAWKPAGQIQTLIKAGALIAAEVDRLRRIEA